MPAPIRPSRPKRLLRRSIETNGSGEFSGTSISSKPPLDQCAHAYGLRLVGTDAAQDGDQRALHRWPLDQISHAGTFAPQILRAALAKAKPRRLLGIDPSLRRGPARLARPHRAARGAPAPHQPHRSRRAVSAGRIGEPSVPISRPDSRARAVRALLEAQKLRRTQPEQLKPRARRSAPPSPQGLLRGRTDCPRRRWSCRVDGVGEDAVLRDHREQLAGHVGRELDDRCRPRS